MDEYHLRRIDKAMTDRQEMERLLTAQRFISLALCRDGDPYLVMLNHGYDRERRYLYFHCAGAGKKLDFMQANPRVWGMAVEDLGYQDGACDHHYRSVMFGGRVSFLREEEEKRRALEIMIRQQESDPERVIAEQLTPTRVASVTIGRIEIEVMTGKAAVG